MATEEKKIFIVDDDEMTCMMLSDHLSKNSLYEISVFYTGEECIKHLNEMPDVIILDYQLDSVVPGAADGMAILQQVKKIDKEICVIMLSSQESYGKAVQTIIKGALQYVVKGNNAFDEVEAIVASLN